MVHWEVYVKATGWQNESGCILQRNSDVDWSKWNANKWRQSSDGNYIQYHNDAGSGSGVVLARQSWWQRWPMHVFICVWLWIIKTEKSPTTNLPSTWADLCGNTLLIAEVPAWSWSSWLLNTSWQWARPHVFRPTTVCSFRLWSWCRLRCWTCSDVLRNWRQRFTAATCVRNVLNEWCCCTSTSPSVRKLLNNGTLASKLSRITYVVSRHRVLYEFFGYRTLAFAVTRPCSIRTCRCLLLGRRSVDVITCWAICNTISIITRCFDK